MVNTHNFKTQRNILKANKKSQAGIFNSILKIMDFEILWDNMILNRQQLPSCQEMLDIQHPGKTTSLSIYSVSHVETASHSKSTDFHNISYQSYREKIP